MIPWTPITTLIVILLVAILLAFILGALAAGGGLSKFMTGLTNTAIQWAPGHMAADVITAVLPSKEKKDGSDERTDIRGIESSEGEPGGDPGAVSDALQNVDGPQLVGMGLRPD